MKWFAAHMIMIFEYSDPRITQNTFFVHENVLIFLANDTGEAAERAETEGRRQEALVDPSLTLNGEAAKKVFGGVRKVVECEPLDGQGVLSDGAEVTYSELTLEGRASLDRFIAGEPVWVLYD
jgi:hypothetical protein